MKATGLGTALGLCVLAASPLAAQDSQSPDAAPKSGWAAQLSVTPAPSWPKVLPAGKDSAETPKSWSPQDIQLAEARCAALLNGLDIVSVPEAPIREGAECGTPAAMKLLAIGKRPQVVFSPPPIVTCDMIAALHSWLQQGVQPLARKHLGAPIVRVETMSSYSCRNAYGRAKGRLSEHGRANALDIGAFATDRGHTALVVADWGPTARDIALAAAQAEENKARVQTAREDGQAGNAAAAFQPVNPAPLAVQGLRAGVSIAIPGITIQAPGQQPQDALSGLGFSPANRLGGPKPSGSVTAPAEPRSAGKMEFLRGAQRAGCKIFSTVLGPEANDAHKNHFHVDMAERAHNTTICE